jgi:periplasmic divalent cation tolerance protein
LARFIAVERLALSRYIWGRMPRSTATADPDPFVVVFVTAPSAEVAAAIAQAVVGERLAACVNIVPGLRSIYAWQGKLCDDAEVLCIVKTRRALFPALRDRVAALHPYEVPEIIALPIADGSAPYLAWLQHETKTPSP